MPLSLRRGTIHVLFENDAVRVLDTRIAPGETVPLHTHRWPSALYLVNWSDFVRRDGAGTVLADSRGGRGAPEGSALWSGPLPPHTLENVGMGELRVITVELKGTGPNESELRSALQSDYAVAVAGRMSSTLTHWVGLARRNQPVHQPVQQQPATE